MVDLKFWNILKNAGQSSTPNSTTMSENTRTETLCLNYRTEEVNSRDNISNLYSEGTEFESQPGHAPILAKVLVVSLRTSRKMPGWGLH